MRSIKTTAGILIVSPLLFWGGWNIGKVVYPETINQPEQKSQVALFSAQLTTQAPATKVAKNVCAETIVFKEEADRRYCFQPPKVTEQKGLQIDLTAQKAILFENGTIIDILPVAYQSPEQVWFQTPTGYFRVGFMREKHRSSLFPVNMPYAIQITEDFFMHEIPFYDDGTKVTTKFSGGCLRFETDVAKRLFDFLKPNDQLVIYKTTDNLIIKEDLHTPVTLDQFWIRQRFNSPLRTAWNYSGNLDKLLLDYDQHTGIDLAPNKDATDLNAYAITDGTVITMQQNDGQDHGMGATIIVAYTINGTPMYGVYAHLASIANNVAVGDQVTKGAVLGTVGNTAYGCHNYWKIGDDGCVSTNPNDIHLHFELKVSPVLENPNGGTACIVKTIDTTNQDTIKTPHACYGYVPGDPKEYGYLNPLTLLFNTP